MDIATLVVNVLMLTLSSTVTPPLQATSLEETSIIMPVIYGVYSTHTTVSPKPQATPIPSQQTFLSIATIPQNPGSCFDYTERYADLYNVDKNLLDRIIQAESGGNPVARNPRSTASGCAQFIQSTWAGTRRQMGREWVTPFDAEANVETMAWKIANGGLNAWNASRSKWAN